MIAAIVTDIEGTTSSIDFVHKVLFPYSAAALPAYVREHLADPLVAASLQQVAADAALAASDTDALIGQLLAWVAEDRKHTALKTLQGLIWQAGYVEGEFTAHVYADVPGALRRWRSDGLDLYVYSSGSVGAQKLFFAHTEAGDLLGLFAGHFDTTSGGKREAASYQRIASDIGAAPPQLLFLSDIVEELDAARDAGWHTVLLQRERAEIDFSVNGHRCVADFDAIDSSLLAERPKS